MRKETLNMNIAVIGLGLIGGSICKALKANTFHHIMGIDTNPETIKKALEIGAIDEEITEDRLGEANLTIVALYPVPTVEVVKKNADKFRKGSIVMDVCGVKGYTVYGCTPVLDERGVYFIGTHPMAGTENSGFDYATADLFKGASYILTPMESTPQIVIDLVTTLGSCMGFGQVVIATPEQHDANRLHLAAGSCGFKRLCKKPLAVSRRRLLCGQFLRPYPRR